jgi:hypothetical protein
MPFCVASRQKWLQALMAKRLNKTGVIKGHGHNGILKAV